MSFRGRCGTVSSTLCSLGCSINKAIVVHETTSFSYLGVASTKVAWISPGHFHPQQEG